MIYRFNEHSIPFFRGNRIGWRVIDFNLSRTGKGRRRIFSGELEVDLADGIFNIGVETGFTSCDEVIDTEDASYRGRGKAKDAQDFCQLFEVGGGMAGFNQLVGENADEGDLVDEGFEVGGFFIREVTWGATSVETMFESVIVTERGAEAFDGSKVVGHKGSLRSENSGKKVNRIKIGI